ncbi:hypothetical protein BC831DRAFT_451836 [Entophlyctis helioformis]|nr:hypothetical protein BC831DRAFT_451836 [Entophlyctis helioformis]
MPVTIPFDPPRFEQPEDFVAAIIGLVSFPLVCYAWYHAAVAFVRTRKMLPATLLALLSCAGARNVVTMTATFLYTSLPILLLRLWLYCVEMYILNVWIMFFLLWMMKNLTVWMLPVPCFCVAWVPTAFAVVMNGIYFGMFLPRAFYYTLFMTPSENNWAAKWYRTTFNPYLLVANIIGAIICGFVVFTLHWNFSKLANRLGSQPHSSTGAGSKESSSTTGTATENQETTTDQSANRESVFQRAINGYRASIKGKLPKSAVIQSTVFSLTVFLTLYVVISFIVFGLSSLNDAVIRPAPSAGWRKAQSLTCIAGHLVILNSVVVWTITMNLKGLKIKRPGSQPRSSTAVKPGDASSKSAVKDNSISSKMLDASEGR